MVTLKKTIVLKTDAVLNFDVLYNKYVALTTLTPNYCFDSVYFVKKKLLLFQRNLNQKRKREKLNFSS